MVGDMEHLEAIDRKPSEAKFLRRQVVVAPVLALAAAGGMQLLHRLPRQPRCSGLGGGIRRSREIWTSFDRLANLPQEPSEIDHRADLRQRLVDMRIDLERLGI